MNVIYECEICGFTSRNKSLVEKCEKKGKGDILPKGEEVEFWMMGCRNWVKGKITNITFRKRSHKIVYRIISNDSATPNFCRNKSLSVPSQNVRRVYRMIPENNIFQVFLLTNSLFKIEREKGIKSPFKKGGRKMILKRDLEKAKQGNMKTIENLCDAYWADIEDTGREKIAEALKEGLKKAINRFANGENIGYELHSLLIDHAYYPGFRKELKDLIPEYKKAEHKWTIIDTKKLIQRFENQEISIKDYQDEKYWWLKRIDKHAPKKLKEQFYSVLNAFRKAQGIDRMEKVRSLINENFGNHSFFEEITGMKEISDEHKHVFFNKKTGRINFTIKIDWPDSPEKPGFGTKILKEFKKKYGLNARTDYHPEYTPEDMDTPLEGAYWTLSVSTYEKKLASTINLVKAMMFHVRKAEKSIIRENKKEELKELLKDPEMKKFLKQTLKD